jgi:hypothetical protein
MFLLVEAGEGGVDSGFCGGLELVAGDLRDEHVAGRIPGAGGLGEEGGREAEEREVAEHGEGGNRAISAASRCKW